MAGPCPEDATIHSCGEWCKAVHPGSRATMGGSPCARLSSQDLQRGMGPACTCYDSSYERELQSCRSQCPEAAEAMQPFTGEEELCFGSVGQDTCRADQLTSKSERFLLYDVKPGEGFNLQREVFPRVAWVVAQVNTALQKLCAGSGGASSTSSGCGRWSLVLPPWCRLAHWRSSSEEHVPWARFFDAEKLKSGNVTVLEFHEFVQKAGGPLVDLVVSTSTERLPAGKMRSKPRKSGGFYGFARTAESCFKPNGLKPPRQEWLPEEQRWRVTYSGNCAEGVAAIDHRCAVLADSSSRDWVDLVLVSMREGVRSVLLKAADSVGPPAKEEMDALGLRAAMVFARPLRDLGERYMREVLRGRPFLAVHIRRTDFLYAREKTTPKPEEIGNQLELAMADFKVDQVYVATDAVSEVREALKELRGKVLFLEDMPEVASEAGLLEGEVAAIEMWIAARAAAFLGTQESRFTMHIQQERAWLGQSFASSNRELCKAMARGRCYSPYFKAGGTAAENRREYWP
ncbi:unnamed protein product [Effrenium voratum]|uniref:GDP-fucose protein O-fucosyltransferase 2 n=1 Tax=Effrenium voratum TaxID=2562239 RepID=A0AA36I6I2_9DINO|nr:unnamed protein product [Effrenium voratum]